MNNTDVSMNELETRIRNQLRREGPQSPGQISLSIRESDIVPYVRTLLEKGLIRQKEQYRDPLPGEELEMNKVYEWCSPQ